MQRAIALCAVAIIGFAHFANAAPAELTSETPQFYGHIYVDVVTGNVTYSPGEPNPAVGIDVYSNVTSQQDFGVGVSDLSATWGDRVTTVGVGMLSEFSFCVFNRETFGVLLTANVMIRFYDAATSAPLGNFGVFVDFGAGLPGLNYTVINVTGLDMLGIDLNTNDVLVTQQITSLTGNPLSLGVVSAHPPTVGTSGLSMYIDSPLYGPPGYYNFGQGYANPLYRINVSQPLPTENTTWGHVKALYR